MRARTSATKNGVDDHRQEVALEDHDFFPAPMS